MQRLEGFWGRSAVLYAPVSDGTYLILGVPFVRRDSNSAVGEPLREAGLAIGEYRKYFTSANGRRKGLTWVFSRGSCSVGWPAW